MAFHTLLRAAIGAAAIALCGSAAAIDQLKVMVPAGPGGGFDQTGRSLGAAMQAAGSVKSIQYDNKGGAGGAIGLAQFVSTSKGDRNALIVAGHGDGRRDHTNKTPVDARQRHADRPADRRIRGVVVPTRTRRSSR